MRSEAHIVFLSADFLAMDVKIMYKTNIQISELDMHQCR